MDWSGGNSCRYCYHSCWCCCSLRWVLLYSGPCGKCLKFHFISLDSNPGYFYVEKNEGKEDGHHQIIPRITSQTAPLPWVHMHDSISFSCISSNLKAMIEVT